MEQERLLVNPHPKYWLDIGTECLVGTNAAHGCETIFGYIRAKKDISGESGYVFKYMSPDDPHIELTANIPANAVFLSQAELEEVRKSDRSAQEQAVRNACSTNEKLISFLLARSGLCETDRKIVLMQAETLGIIEPEDPSDKTDGKTDTTPHKKA